VGPGAGRVNALERSQLAAVAGLCADVLRITVLRELRRAGALALPRACALLELAEALLAERPARLDAAEWLEAAEARDPALRAALDQALMPPPGSVPVAWEDAVQHLRRHHEAESAKAECLERLRRGDLSTNAEALRAVDAILRRRGAGGATLAREDSA